ncbi:ABC transporter substrate-binding protein [Natronomonas halophila]|uniref:ABC transporter substrate-binding protein n=1 Tax=Natronomonas halophila TaxID=2747817 RepID=UPI0015B70008|nr:ABC transporter substrate-binding protein [Natronomonas halophila]QLD85016.1 ABC transporter substrate-binding protein [Natronomonas halophila]
MASDPSLQRRAFLTGAAGTAAATSGCIGNLRNLIGRDAAQQLSLNIATLPASADPYAVRIANQLSKNLNLAGIDAGPPEPMEPDVLLRNILINQDFDLYVLQYPSEGYPGELRSMLYSAYGEEAGWQNPFGFSDLEMDDRLDAQQAAGPDTRVEAVRETQRQVVRVQPFTVVAFPDHIAGVRTDRFTGWDAGGLPETANYFQLESTGETDELSLLLQDPRATKNRNPIAVEHRNRGVVIGLFYDPLVRRIGGTPTPWLASSVEWDERGDGLAATIRLREADWHDGEPLTASDVAFTYEFLNDTSLGTFETSVPTPWRRGRVDLVDDVEVQDDRTLRMAFTTENVDTANRALEVLMLPEHVWSERTDPADLAGVELAGQTTEALVWANEDPVGSGPLRFESAQRDENLNLVRFEDHFLHRGDTEGIPDPYASGIDFERLNFEVMPSADTAVEVLENDNADASANSLEASVVPRIGRNDDITLTITRGQSFYHIGYNCREAPMSDPRFRRTVARLIDREHLISSVFDDYAEASEVPFTGEWTPEGLEWDGTAELSFLGADGELAVDAAQEAFMDAGYQYEDDRLVRRGGD